MLRAAFVPIFLRQKSTKLKRKYEKAVRKTFVQTKAARKMMVKLTLGSRANSRWPLLHQEHPQRRELEGPPGHSLHLRT